MPCNVCQVCRDIYVSSLNSENRLCVLLLKIKSLHAKIIHNLANMTYDKFETFDHPVEMNIKNYLNEFERLYMKKTMIWNCQSSILCSYPGNFSAQA